MFANPPHSLCGDTNHQCVRGNVLSYDCAGADHGPGANRYGGNADCPGSNGCASAYRNAYAGPVFGCLGLAAGGYRSGELVVGEDRTGSDEDSVTENRRLVDKGIVLDLAVVSTTAPSPTYAPVLSCSPPHDCMTSHLRQVPHHRAETDPRAIIYVCCRMNAFHGQL